MNLHPWHLCNSWFHTGCGHDLVHQFLAGLDERRRADDESGITYHGVGLGVGAGVSSNWTPSPEAKSVPNTMRTSTPSPLAAAVRMAVGGKFSAEASLATVSGLLE